MRENRITAPTAPEPDIFTDEMLGVAVGVGDEADLFERVRAKARRGDRGDRGARQAAVANLSFESPERLFEVLSPKRFELFRSVRERGSFASIEELASVVQRDRATVSKDVRQLAALGLIVVETVVHPGHGRRSTISAAARDIRVQFAL